MEVIGSVEELEKRCGQKITDLHRENIDNLTINSLKTGKQLHRIDDVFDCWFESGSMPYARCHYPFAFEDEKAFERIFPAHCIAEGLDQTRGWFYTLLVISTALFDKPAFQNVVVNGMVVAENGGRMFSNRAGYRSVQGVINIYGADALRIYLCKSPAVRGEILRFSESGISSVITSVLTPWWNAYNFFVNSAKTSFKYDCNNIEKVNNIMDKWILSKLQSLIKYFRSEMDAYRLYNVIPRLLDFIHVLCNIYIHMNRKRINSSEDYSLHVMFHVLLTLCKLMAPISPFIVETMYLNLRNALGTDTEISIHFMQIPMPMEEIIDLNIERKMQNVCKLIKLGRSTRVRYNLKTKLALSKMLVFHQDLQFVKDIEELKQYIQSELNVKSVECSNTMADYIRLSAEPQFRSLGIKFRKKTGLLAKAIRKLTHEEVVQLSKRGKLIICDEEINTENVKLIWNFNGDKNKWAYQEHDGCVVLMNKCITKRLKDECIIREICHQIQFVRKENELDSNDLINCFFEIDEKDEKGLLKEDNNLLYILKQYNDEIKQKIGINVLPLTMKSKCI
eukprot:449193_1